MSDQRSHGENFPFLRNVEWVRSHRPKNPPLGQIAFELEPPLQRPFRRVCFGVQQGGHGTLNELPAGGLFRDSSHAQCVRKRGGA